MTLEATVTDLVNATTALHDAVRDKKTVLDNAAQQAAASLTATQSKQAEATASAAAAAASAATATSRAAEITAFKTAATALNTSTTATQAVTNLLPDMLAKKDPARHPFRNKLPSLVLDFERQKAHRYSDSTGFAETPLASLMTFTRNSTATYTGPDGVLRTAGVNQPRYDYDPVTGECKGLLVEEQRTNLVTQGDLRAVSNWNNSNCTVIPNSFVAPDGTLTAIKLVANAQLTAHHLSQAVTTTSISTITVYVRDAGIGYFGLSWRSNGDLRYDVVRYNLSTVSKVVLQNASGLYVSDSITSIGNGWIKITVVVNSPSQVRLILQDPVQDRKYSSGFSGDGVKGAHLWGVQVEAGAFPTSYIPTPTTFTGRASTATYLDVNGVVQTAGVGVARSAAYDYDADGVLRPIGLLLEYSATNLLLYSSDYTNAAWGKIAGGVSTAPTITPAYGTAPDGTTTAQRVQLALNSGTTIDDISSLQQGVVTVAGSTYTASVWLKTADGSTKTVQLSFNSENPQLLTVTGTWKRYSITGVASDTIRGFRLALRGTAGTSDSADLLVWGAQHGLGNYATSYIPTTTAQVTRAADSSTSAQATRVADDAKVDGTKFSDFYNQTQGTLVARGVSAPILIAPISQYLVAVTDGTNRNLFNINKGTSTSKLRAMALVGGTMTVSVPVEADTQPSATTAASLRMAKNDVAFSVLGAAVATDTSTLIPVVTKLQVGARNGNGDGTWNGHVSSISYYPQPFTNEELQTFTAP